MKSKKHRAGSDDRQLASLAPLAREIPDIDSAIAEIARLTAELTLPEGTTHVISDIHGEDKKLRHVINNASGTLRPLVEGLLKGQMPAEELQQFLTLVFYPAEMVALLEVKLRTAQAQKQFAMKALRALFAIVRALAARRTLQHAVRLFPRQYRELLAEILHEPSSDREREYVEAILHELARRRRVLHLIHLTCRVVRDLAIHELIIAGDCWVMQFKLEGQLIARHPEWQMEHRRLLHRIDRQAGTIEVDGVSHRLKGAHFPTLEPAHPYELTADESRSTAPFPKRTATTASRWSWKPTGRFWPNTTILNRSRPPFTRARTSSPASRWCASGTRPNGWPTANAAA
jgi:fructose-1,6-bisphosphatase